MGTPASRMPSAASARRRSGTSFTVRTFTVMSSPVVPSPRVAARMSRPFSYVNATDEPSIFSSHTSSGMLPKNSRTRSSHSSSSSAPMASSSEYMRRSCWMGANWSPT